MRGREVGDGAAARLHLVDGVALLRPDEQVFQAMLNGWRNQQLARNLAFSTIEQRERTVRAFVDYTNAFPWDWTPQFADEWFADLRAIRHCARSTLRSYQDALRSFGDYVTSSAYEWPAECERRFGTFPVPVIHDGNAASMFRRSRRLRRSARSPWRSCRRSSTTPTTRCSRPAAPAARAGCPRSAMRRCSSPPTPTGCGATRLGCSTPWTSVAIRTSRSSASSDGCGCGSARPRRDRRPSSAPS